VKSAQHIDYYSKIYPKAWEQIEEYRAAKGKWLPDWPDWCFIPLAATYIIVNLEIETQRIELDCETGFPLLNDVSIIGALAAWRLTQRVYRFDPDVYQTVMETPLSDDLPRDIFFNLPEWCVYIETPDFMLDNEKLDGFFAYLDFDTENEKSELRIVLDYCRPLPCLYSIPISLDSDSLTEVLDKTMDRAVQRSQGSTVDIQPLIRELRKSLTSILSLTMYLCATNGEFGRKGKRPTKPSKKKTPPTHPKVWDLGLITGDALRETTAVSHSPYWRGYWTEHSDGHKQYILKWISPLATEDKNDISYN